MLCGTPSATNVLGEMKGIVTSIVYIGDDTSRVSVADSFIVNVIELYGSPRRIQVFPLKDNEPWILRLRAYGLNVMER